MIVLFEFDREEAQAILDDKTGLRGTLTFMANLTSNAVVLEGSNLDEFDLPSLSAEMREIAIEAMKRESRRLRHLTTKKKEVMLLELTIEKLKVGS
jgi:hypothetical protein